MSGPGDTFTVDVVRVDDALALRFTFVNLVRAQGAATLTRVDADQPAFVIVDPGPQHLAEAVSADPGPVLAQVGGRLAGASRLAFRLPDATSELTLSLDALLAWESWTPSLVPVALAPGPAPGGVVPPLRAPADTETAIELPYRLLLSPDDHGRWDHQPRPVMRRRRVEQWHTRLAGSVRAVWSPDVVSDPAAAPPDDPAFITTLRPVERHEIVHQSADFALQGGQPAAIDATVMLTSTGGGLHALGSWPVDGGPISLSQWEHIATGGRDHYVRTVHDGILLPFGHRAAHVTVSERQVLTNPADAADPIAELRQRQFVIVREPERVYDPATYANGGREFPFSTAVRFVTLVTPDLDPPPVQPNESFVVQCQGREFPFALEGIDHDGRPTAFRAPCLFVDESVLGQGPETLGLMYASLGLSTRLAELDGQRVAFAPASETPDAGAPSGHADLATDTLQLTVQSDDAGTVALPAMDKATVQIPALAALGTTTATTIRLHDTFLDHGMDPAANPLAEFAQLAENAAPIGFAFPADQSAGLVTPSMAVRTISRLRGPLGDLAGASTGTFDPKAFFADAKLLGGVSLADLIDTGLTPDQLPRIVSERQPPQAPVPDAIVTTVDWIPQTRDNPVLRWQDPPGGQPRLELRVVADAPLDRPVSTSVTAVMRAFTLSIPSVDEPYVTVAFKQLSCTLKSGGKPQISAVLADAPDTLVFGGPLAFMNELEKVLPADGFDDPPAVDLTPTGLDVGYDLALPPVSVGVFNLQDLSLGASLHLPFTGDPARLRLAFSERAHPCVLTVSLFGGGAFLGLSGGTDGIEVIEGAVEFGGSFALNIVVASGGVTAMAGIYFKYDATQPKDQLTLSGYFRVSGEVSVLGLISVSVDLMLSLTYETGSDAGGGTVSGDASLTVKVDILFFSKSVSLHVHRSFGGHNADPDFAALMAAPADWTAYTEAFA